MKFLKLYENIKNIDPFDEEDWDEVDLIDGHKTKDEFMIYFLDFYDEIMENNMEYLIDIISYTKNEFEIKVGDIRCYLRGYDMGDIMGETQYGFDVSLIWQPSMVSIRHKYGNFDYNNIYFFTEYYYRIKDIWDFIRKKIKKDKKQDRIKKIKRFIGLKENFDFNEDDFDFEEYEPLKTVTFDTPLGTTVKYVGDQPEYKGSIGEIILNKNRLIVDFGPKYRYEYERYIEFSISEKFRNIGQGGFKKHHLIITLFIHDLRIVNDLNEGFLSFFKKDKKDKNVRTVYYTQSFMDNDKVSRLMKIITPEWIKNDPVAFEVFDGKLYLTEGHHRFEAAKRLDDKDILKSLFDSALYYDVNRKPRYYKKRIVKMNESIDIDPFDEEDWDEEEYNNEYYMIYYKHNIELREILVLSKVEIEQYKDIFIITDKHTGGVLFRCGMGI